MLEYLRTEIDVQDFRPGIVSAIEFAWGFVYYWNDQRCIDDPMSNYCRIGNSPILLDRLDHSIHFIDYLDVLDEELENYRDQKGYAWVIKFPPGKDLTQLNDVEKAIALMETQELAQIEQAIKLVREKQLFDLDEFVKALTMQLSSNYGLDIARSISSPSLFAYQSPIDYIPKEILVVRERITAIELMNSKIKELPSFILEMTNLESIWIYDTPLEKMPFDLTALRKLKSISLDHTHITPDQARDFILPQGCELVIE